jgi:hypothetical protein
MTPALPALTLAAAIALAPALATGLATAQIYTQPIERNQALWEQGLDAYPPPALSDCEDKWGRLDRWFGLCDEHRRAWEAAKAKHGRRVAPPLSPELPKIGAFDQPAAAAAWRLRMAIPPDPADALRREIEDLKGRVDELERRQP